ncbi:MAG: protein BatD [Bacteroidetes bacterium]|nr:protein BatD [Bacteroidota bacterium]
MENIKRLLTHSIILCGAMLFFYQFVGAQSFTATVNRNQVAVGDRFQITFTIEGGNGNAFKQPDFKDFQVIGGPFQSNNFTMVNGRTTVSSSYSYYLTPLKEGSLKIGSASVNIDGKTYTSNAITMTCTKGQASNQAQSQNPGVNNGANNATSATSNKQVFIRASIDKSNLYIGEGVLITYKLYTSVALSSPMISDLPSFNGFWSSEINVPENTPATYENYNGTRYATLVVKKFILFPQQSGTITIDPMKGEAIAQVQVKRNRNPNDPFDIFNDPFFGGGYQNQKVEIRSDAFKINVKDLPANAPASFNGAVGRLQFDAQLDKGETKANEAVTLKVKVSGKGNLKLVEAPKISVPGDIETYDPKVDDNINVSESGTSGNKTFEYLLIPRHEGEYTIDALRFSYFDLETKTYKEVAKGPFTIKVAKGDGNNATVIENAGANKTDVAVISKDIRYIKPVRLCNRPEATTFMVHGNFIRCYYCRCC